MREAPIGVFDSGVGGLSVLRHIHAQLPHEHLLYFADSGFAPYGDKPEHVVAERSLAIAAFLVARGAKALVVACNTATVAAIRLIREHYPDMPIVGVEHGSSSNAMSPSGFATPSVFRSTKPNISRFNPVRLAAYKRWMTAQMNAAEAML